MAVCTYDNPATMQRECWQDGELVCAYNHKLFFLPPGAGVIPAEQFFFGANIGPWVMGRKVGDPSAVRLPTPGHPSSPAP